MSGAVAFGAARSLRLAGRMIERVVRYLSDAAVPFRLAVYPMPEPQPEIAYPMPAGAQLVDTRMVLVDGRPGIACGPHGIPMNLAALGTELDAVVLEATSAELRDEFRGAPEPLPPLGGLLGALLFVDDELAATPSIVFRAFSQGAYFELLYDDLALVERPRVASFAQGGELPPAAEPPRANV